MRVEWSHVLESVGYTLASDEASWSIKSHPHRAPANLCTHSLSLPVQCCHRCCTCCCPSAPLARGAGGYQPVQYVVANGTTTLPNGQRAMVILLPAGLLWIRLEV